MKILKIVLVLSCLAGATGVAAAGDTTFNFYGFLKGDAIYDFKRMDPDWNSTMRPSKILIPREGKPYYENGEFNFNVRASRLGLDVVHEPGGRPLRGQLEIDFYGTGSQPSQLLPRLRQAHIVYGDFVIGQAWSQFCDVDAFPQTLDFWGPNGLLASRRPQVRWTIEDGDVQTITVALENPGAGLDEGKAPSIDPEFGSRDRNLMPDLTAAYRLAGNWGYLRLAGVARRVGYERTDISGPESKGAKFGWGGYLTGRFAVQERNAIQFALLYGQGVANYINDGGSDVTGNDDGTDAEILPLGSWHASYLVWWSPTYATSLGYSEVLQENTDFQDDDAFHRGRYAYVNLVRHPQEGLSYGLEFLWGKLDEKDGVEGENYRLQFSTRFAF
jgi:hypothetical protein